MPVNQKSLHPRSSGAIYKPASRFPKHSAGRVASPALALVNLIEHRR